MRLSNHSRSIHTLKNIIPHLLITLITILGSGCSSVIHSYPAQMESVKATVANNKFDSALGKIAKKTKGKDACLYLQESGRIASFKSDTKESISFYEKAGKIIDEEWGKPILSFSDVANTAESLILNDNAIPYSAQGYERIFIHTFQMLNYLTNEDLEGAAVEARKANYEHIFIADRHEKGINIAKKDAQKEKMDLKKNSVNLSKISPAMDLAAGKAKNSFQNAFTFYLSGVIWECMNDLDNAYVSYQQALELFPENECVKNDVFRLANRLNRQDDLKNMEKAFGSKKPKQPETNEGRLVIVYEEGYVPKKEQFKFPVFVAKKTYTIALPYYKSEWKIPHQLSIQANNQALGQTEIICSTYTLAAKALEEAYTAIVIRQALRLAAKGEVQKYTEKATPIIGLAVGISSIIFERADRRSWLTLPNTVQVGSFHLTEGSHTIELSPIHGENKPIEVSIKPNKTTFIRVIDTGAQSIVTHTQPI